MRPNSSVRLAGGACSINEAVTRYMRVTIEADPHHEAAACKTSLICSGVAPNPQASSLRLRPIRPDSPKAAIASVGKRALRSTSAACWRMTGSIAAGRSAVSDAERTAGWILWE